MSQLITEVSPHIHDKTTVRSIMLDVIIALMPALVAGIILFGFRALLVVAVCVISSVFFEWLFELICKKKNTVGDLSAAVTGLLLGLNMPVEIELWQAIFGSAVAIIVVKQLFGGIGKNFANPAITARIIMLVTFSSGMSRWSLPLVLEGADTATSATPLAILTGVSDGQLPSVWQMLLGVRGGCIGETCIIALLIGGAYLLIKRCITWHTPVAFLGTVLVMTLALGENGLYHLLSGGVVLGAFFMATDYTTTPCTPWGKVIFGVGCGFMTVVIRLWGMYPEGVSFAILFMNILTPHIEKLTLSRPFGGAKA